ncbi:hypothetical protein NQ176_g2811 [Zarea fungicola]|uniref:Uncharacterized protein n=1 Tax=Zarea fungicola TaxID=93591 RepID=A0ACC1NLK0_9HYPO|nr:hypothetical protein NQ176_g2811 [Lecanicillium fungicola]
MVSGSSSSSGRRASFNIFSDTQNVSDRLLVDTPPKKPRKVPPLRDASPTANAIAVSSRTVTVMTTPTTETLSAGTYTFIYDGTTKAVVVPSPTATETELVTTTWTATVTVTNTEYPTARMTITASVTQTTANTTHTAGPTSTASPTCPSYCDCEPKYGNPEEYEECISQPECAGCGIQFPPLPNTTEEPTTTPWQNSTATAPTWTSPTPSCGALLSMHHESKL